MGTPEVAIAAIPGVAEIGSLAGTAQPAEATPS